MITVVIVLNVLISLLCLYVAWYLWNLRRALAIAADVLTLFDRDTHNVLYGAPNAISQGQLGLRAMRGNYRQLETQLQQIQQVLALLGLVQSLLQVAVRSSTRLRQSRLDAPKLRSRARRLRRQQRLRM